MRARPLDLMYIHACRTVVHMCSIALILTIIIVAITMEIGPAEPNN